MVYTNSYICNGFRSVAQQTQVYRDNSIYTILVILCYFCTMIYSNYTLNQLHKGLKVWYREIVVGSYTHNY